MKTLDDTAIRSIATAVTDAVSRAEERAYTPFDGDCCRFDIDSELDLDDGLGLSGCVTGSGTAWYVNDGDGYSQPVATEISEIRFSIDSIVLWDSLTEEPAAPSMTAQVMAMLENRHHGKLTA